MAQWNKTSNSYPSQTSSLFEAVLLAHANGVPYSAQQLHAQADNGRYYPLASTPEGHLEVSVHSPRLPFGEIHVESINPIFQVDAVYGINQLLVKPTTGVSFGSSPTTGSVSAANNIFRCATGNTAFSFATLQSRRRLRYRPGQGVLVRYTSRFSTPKPNSILVAGVGTSESGFYFGYNGNTFGILHSTNGLREVQTLQVTTASTSTQPYQVVLAGNTYTVTATNNGNLNKTAYEISKGSFGPWDAQQQGANVIFIHGSAGNRTGTFSLAQAGAGTPAAGSFTETIQGKATADVWVPQSQWNGEKLDGTGKTGIILDPSKGNVYQVQVQYLGFGAVQMQVEINPTGNNPDFVTVHTFDFPNNRSMVSVSQPSFPFTMAAYSAGNASDVWVESACFAGFVVGMKKLIGPRMTYQRDTNNYVGSVAATYYPLFTIRNDRMYAGRVNQAIVNLLSVSASHDDATPITIFLLRDATLNGTPVFNRFAQYSCTSWDTAATTASIDRNDQIIESLKLGQNGSLAFQFEDEVTLQPGETITLAAQAVTGTATYVSASVNTREDQ